jgi:hypothetical protein
MTHFISFTFYTLGPELPALLLLWLNKRRTALLFDVA